MKPERKRALLIIVATLLVGIVIGALGMNMVNKRFRKPMGKWREEGKEHFMQWLIKESGADSAQAKLMRPLMMETMSKIDSLQFETDKRVRQVIDTFELKLKPILREEQLEKLRKYHPRNREGHKK